MQYRILGSTELEASILGLGGNRLAESPDRNEVRATFELALERGINLIDLADCYGRGETERLVGRWIRGRRDDVILSSKVGYRPPMSVRYGRWVDPVRRWIPSRPGRSGGSGRPRPKENFTAKTLVTGIAGSLRRLGTDWLDIFYLHDPPPEVVADVKNFDVLDQEKRAGRIRHYGISLHGRATTDEVLACFHHPGVAVVQVRVNRGSTVDLDRVGTAAAEAGAAIVAREPFLKGRLLAAETLAVGAVPTPTPAQRLLKAVLQRPAVCAVLVGTTQRSHLIENLAALESEPLREDEMAALWAQAEVL